MYQERSINLLRFLLSLSGALDLVSPELAQHQLRTAYISWKIGEAAKMTSANLEPVFVAALLHDIGALTPEDKVSIHCGAYERDLDQHCRWGEKVLRRNPFFDLAGRIVRQHHTHWQASRQSQEMELARQAQILYLADVIERAISRKQYILHQDHEIVARITAKAGTEFDPLLVEAFRSLAGREEFWLDLASPRMSDLLLEHAPFRDQMIPQTSFLAVAELVRDITDFRSPFTSTHSTGVSAAAVFISKLVGLSEPEIELMRIVGALHDLGKMAVPNAILEKKGPLTAAEFAVMRQHTYHTYTILLRTGFSQFVAEWAGFHHERLNGSGYPFHIKADHLTVGSRIIAVADIFTALAEDRPYRRGLSGEQTIEVLRVLVEREAIDARLVRLVQENYEDLHQYTRTRQTLARQYYEEEFGKEIFEQVS